MEIQNILVTNMNKSTKDNKNKIKYTKPKLQSFGKLAKLTLGFSMPDGESGMTNTEMGTP